MTLKDKLLKLWKFFTTREMILYIAFGVSTTLINLLVFHFSYQSLQWSWQAANILAWVLAVAFAFITNKLWVFESKSMKPAVLLRECAEFFGARLLSLGVDYACLWLLIDCLHWGDIWAKLLDNIFVVIINYALSKLIVFRKKEADK